MNKLKNIKFSDLYIDPERPTEAMIRGLDGSSEGLEKIGEDLIGDTTALAAKVRMKHLDEKENDFLTVHDGERYRCSLITAGVNGPSSSFYCLRRIASDSFSKIWSQTHPSLKHMASTLSDKRGLAIFSGTFSTGKTRNASACIDYWAKSSQEVVVTLEDPPEYNLDRRGGSDGVIIQTNVIGGKMGQELVNLRRWAPRYVFFGELRTPETAAALLHLSISGPLCLCTIHASSATQAIFSLVRFASEVMKEETALELISSSLHGIVHHERYGDKFRAVTHVLSDSDASLLRAKIRNGKASTVEEELNRRILARR